MSDSLDCCEYICIRRWASIALLLNVTIPIQDPFGMMLLIKSFAVWQRVAIDEP